MTPQPHPLRAIFLGALTLVFVAGCASEAYQAKARKEKEAQRAAIASGKYVWYTPVGSSIPILVPKDEITPTEAQRQQTQDVFRDVQHGGVITPGDPESSAANAAHPATR
jgi:hypothetical protein